MATQAPEGIAIEQLRSLPLNLLRPSALVDFILFLACGKAAVRLIVETADGLREIRDWSERWGRDFMADQDGFAVVGFEPGSALQILEIDRRVEAHEIELGLALGYPACCCERIALVGESGIDAHALIVAGWSFQGQYRRINPAGYRSGHSLISHLPCSPTCHASLRIANMARDFVLAHSQNPVLIDLPHSPLVTA